MNFEIEKEINRSMEEWIAKQEGKMDRAYQVMGLKYARKIDDSAWAESCLAFKDAARMFYYLGKEHGAKAAQNHAQRASQRASWGLVTP